MTALLWILLILACWVVVSVVGGALVARCIHLADEQSEAEREAAKRRHPSWRGAA